MPKIKAEDFNDKIFDDVIKTKKKNSKKKNKKKKKKKKKKDKKKKKNKSLKIKNNELSYIGDSLTTANEIYSYKYNKSILNKIFDIFNVNVDVESKLGVSVKDETIAAAIGIGAQLLKKLIEKRIK